MDNQDDLLLEKLLTPPLSRRGFTDQLRLRIEARILGGAMTNKRRFAAFAAVFGGLALFIAIAVINNGMQEPLQQMEEGGTDIIVQASDSTDPELNGADPVQIRSGLLLGLRQDRTIGKSKGSFDYNPIVSVYRTLWISSHNEQLVIKREGSNLLIPYKQDFWIVVPQLTTNNGEIAQTLSARVATTNREQLNDIAAEHTNASWSDKVQFIGQQYVAIQRSRISSSRYMVTTLQQIAKGEANPIPLSEVTNADFAEADTTFDWTIARDQGSWSVLLAEPASEGKGSEAEEMMMRDPGKSIVLSKSAVRHDVLCTTWEEIIHVVPAAIDAVCSPKRDMIAIFTTDDIHIHPYTDRIVTDQELLVSLRENERLVMAEWATDDYVDKWDEWTAKLLR